MSQGHKVARFWAETGNKEKFFHLPRYKIWRELAQSGLTDTRYVRGSVAVHFFVVLTLDTGSGFEVEYMSLRWACWWDKEDE